MLAGLATSPVYIYLVRQELPSRSFASALTMNQERAKHGTVIIASQS